MASVSFGIEAPAAVVLDRQAAPVAVPANKFRVWLCECCRLCSFFSSHCSSLLLLKRPPGRSRQILFDSLFLLGHHLQTSLPSMIYKIVLFQRIRNTREFSFHKLCTGWVIGCYLGLSGSVLPFSALRVFALWRVQLHYCLQFYLSSTSGSNLRHCRVKQRGHHYALLKHPV